MSRKKKVMDVTTNILDSSIPKDGFILIDDTDRSILHEGRSTGLGFAPAQRKDNTLTLLQGISACKDFLNDWCYTFNTQKPCSFYGLKTTPIKDIFAYNELYLVMSILKHNNKSETAKYPNYDRDLNALETNYSNLQNFINWFEEKFGIKQFSKIIKLTDNKFLCIANLFWIDATYKISLLSLLLRNGIFYRGGDCMEFLNKTTEDAQDTYSIRAAIPKIKKMCEGFLPKCDFDKIGRIHDYGIVKCKEFDV